MENLIYLVLGIVAALLGLNFFKKDRDPEFEKKEEELQANKNELKKKLTTISKEEWKILDKGVGL